MKNKTENIHDHLIFVGYTNGDQILYAAENEGCMYSDTENDCFIPLYMLKTHAHRLESTSQMRVTLDTVRQRRIKCKNAHNIL